MGFFRSCGDAGAIFLWQMTALPARTHLPQCHHRKGTPTLGSGWGLCQGQWHPELPGVRAP